MSDDNEWKKASTEEKVEHKNWKARVEGYEECIKLFRFCDDPKNPIYLNYLGLVKKFVVDSNQVAQDKALEAVLAFVENVPAAAKTVGEVMPGLISKCLNGKPKTREKAIEIILMYIEAEKQEIVQEELIKGLDNKQPKIVQSCLEILRNAINQFSSKVVPIKPIIKFVPKLLEDRDKTVRDETKLLAVEMYKWAGAAIMPQLQGIKPALLTELEEEFKSAVAAGEKPRQTRFLRSQQDLKAKMEAELEQKMMNGGGASASGGDAGSDIGSVDAAPEAMDPYDLMEPAEILSKLPKDFKEKLEAKKWQERKEVLDNLLAILQKNPRLVPTDYYELVNDLKKMVAKDANVNIVIVAAKCIAGIASGLRKDFSKYALMAIEPLMERFKEKKQNVVDALREACDAIYPSTNLEAIQEIAIGFLGHKTPVVRQQVALFLARCFAMSTQTTLPKKVLKLYLPPLLKNLSEADPTVRDTSSEALGAIYKALGEKIFIPQAGEIEQIKLDKIKEYADKCVLLNLRGEPRAGASAQSAAPAAPKPAATTSAAASAAPAAKKAVITKPTSDGSKPASDAPKKDAAAGPKKVIKGGGGGAADKKQAANALPDESDLAQDFVEEKATELFGAECIAGLANANWKERQQALENVVNQIKRMPTDEVPVQVIVRTIAKKPGFKDSHFQVLKQRLEVISMLADTGYKFTQRSAGYCLIDIADKIGDVKTSQQAKDALSKIADMCTLSYVCTQIVPSIFEAKNPKNQEHCLLWLAVAIKEFGFAGMDMKFLLTHIKASLQNSNATVRSSAIQLIGTIYMYVGPNFRSLFDQEKPALLEQIDAEIEKVKADKPPAPIRGRNMPSAASANGGDGGSGGDEDADDEVNAQLQQEALMPRVDISGQLSDALIEQLNDKNWKERQAALEKLETILRENKFIEPNLNELPTNLNKRLTDTNKILAGTALKITEKLAQALGSQGKRFVSVLAPGMIQALSDNKEALRKTAVSALNAWVDNCGGLAPFIEGDLLLESMNAATNPNIKAELCGWLSSVLNKTKQGKLPPELKTIISIVYTYIEDRNPDVRAQAQELILPLMTHVGPNEMLRVMQKAKPTSITVLQPIIEKARAEVAAKQPAKPAPAPAAKIASAKSVKNLYDDGDDDGAPSAPVSTSQAKKDVKVNGTAAASSSGAAAKSKESTVKPGGASANSAPAASAKKKGNEDEDLGPVMQVSNKNKRIDEEKALKTLKWNFEAPRKEFIEQLKLQMETAGFNRTLLTQLFHDDFKFHMIALQTLSKAVDEATEATISNLDLILRWLTLRFFETNPTVILKAIEYMQALFTMLHARNYHLLDYEANAFVPYFIGKLGDPKDPIRKGFRLIVKQITQVYVPVKVFNFLLQGLTSKNARQRAECLEELGQMIEILGLNPFNPAVTLKEIAKQIGDRDNSVRNAALNTITIAFQIAGDPVYKYIGKLNEKDQSMLDERIKRSSKPGAGPSGVRASVSGSLNQTNQAQQPTMPNSTSMSSISAAAAAASSNSSAANVTHTSGLNGHSATSANNINETASASSRLLSRLNNPTPKKPANTSAMPHVPSSHSKPKGEFSLDIKDDDDDQSNEINIKLTPHDDLDELLNQPIGLPPRKNVTSYPSNILKETQDCREAIDLVITHISHQNIDISFQNLVQIDVVIKDKEKRDFLIPHIDNLLNTCAIKLNIAHNVYLNSHDCQVDQVFRLFKGLFSVIVDIFENDLGKYAQVKSFKDVIYNLLNVMIDSKVLNFAEGDQLIKAINLVTLKLLDLSDQTTSYCALVRLLTEGCNQEMQTNKYLEMVMKCIWRLIRKLSAPTPISDDLVQQIDTSKVLAEIHTFLKTYPPNTWQTRSNDLPLRTAKTLVFHLAKAKQSKILEDLKKIDAPEDSELKAYINKLFKNGFQLSHNNSISNTSFASKMGANQSPEQPQSSPTARALSDQLTAIMKKIGISEQTKEGVRELYEFKQAHPEVDINKYFKNSSGKLLSYIQESFKKMDAERANGTNGNSSKLPSYKNDLIAKKENCSPEKSLNDYLSFKSGTTSSSNLPSSTTTTSSSTRNVEDIMKTIAEWKSKTYINKMDDDDSSSSNNIILNGSDYKSRMAGLMSSNKTSTAFHETNGTSETENGDKYLNMVKDLKKKYTRSRTEADDLKQLDLKAKGFESSISNSNIAGSTLTSLTSQPQQQSANTNGGSTTGTTGTNYAQMSSENLYDEYKRRLELIKKIKPPS